MFASSPSSWGSKPRRRTPTYSDVGRDTLLLVLTASPRNCICPVTWRYPIAGRVPYKGFFNFKQAYQASDKYARLGDDVNLRPSDAFSTLGWLNDPLLSTALTSDSMELAATVFHEIGHNTLWVKGATDFNESFAQWVGYRAAQLFFLSRGDTAVAMRAEGALAGRAKRWGSSYLLLLNRLDSLYALKLAASGERQREGGDCPLEPGHARVRIRTDPAHAHRRTHGGQAEINNAALIGVRLYRTNLDLFDDWDRSNGGDLTKAVYRLHGSSSATRTATRCSSECAWRCTGPLPAPQPVDTSH